MLKVGLVGVGGISPAHIRAWDAMEDVELVALCDIRTERMEKYEGKRAYADFDTMLEEESLDILDICLPTYLHVDFAVKAMEKGIHVLCEKPISLKEEDIDRAYNTAKKYHVNFMIAQVLRFWPEYELIKELYDSQKYGKLLSGYMGRLGLRPKWSWDNWMFDKNRSGLVPFDLHIHDLDFLVYAFGEPSHVQTHRSELPDQDYLSALYEFSDFFVTAESSWYAAPYPFSAGYRFQFEKALVVYEKNTCMIYENNGQILNLSAPEKEQETTINLPTTDAYAAEIRYFADCVKKQIFPDKVRPEQLHTVLDILNRM